MYYRSYVVFYTFRGKDFRKEYGHHGEMRGLLNTSVNVMAVTATATKQTGRIYANRFIY